MGVPVGVATSSNGKALYVAEGWGQRVNKLDAATGRVSWTRSLGASYRPGFGIPGAPVVRALSWSHTTFERPCCSRTAST